MTLSDTAVLINNLNDDCLSPEEYAHLIYSHLTLNVMGRHHDLV